MKTINGLRYFKGSDTDNVLDNVEHIIKDRIKDFEAENKKEYKIGTIDKEIHLEICKVNRAIIVELKNLLG